MTRPIRIAEGDTLDEKDLMTLVCRRTGGKELSIHETENPLGDIMIAGSETVASTLAAISHHVVRAPRISEQLARDIRHHFPPGKGINLETVAKLLLPNAFISSL